jgi:tetratricopeptide (TPR) repeat protein
MEALPAHQEALELRKKLANNNREVALYLRDLQNSQDNVGLVFQGLNRLPEAEAAFEDACKTAETLVAKYPKIPDYLSSSGYCRHNLASVYLNTGDLAKAETAYKKALEAREKLTNANPKTPWYQYGLAETRGSLAVVLSRQGRFAEAESLLKSAQTGLEGLVNNSHDVTDYVSSLGDIYVDRGEHEDRQGHYEAALPYFQRAIDTLVALRVKNPKAERARGYLINAYSARATALTRLNRTSDAIKDWDEALKPALETEKPGIRLGQAATIAKSGDHGKAVAVAEELTKDPKTTGSSLSDAAAVFALAAPAALQDSKLPPADQKATAERYAAQALALLGRAHATGFFKRPETVKALDKEPEWDWLRLRADFKSFRTRLETE